MKKYTNIQQIKLSPRAFEALWKEFSDIQHATYLEQDEESLERFLTWITTGDDEEAWS